MKKIAPLLAAAVVGTILTAAPAHATRTTPEAMNRDICYTNMPGIQNIFDVIRREVIVLDKDKGLCRPGPNWTGWRPCRNEDGPGPCIWDARHMGNGYGKSFILRRDDSIRYIPHWRAHYLLTH